MSASKNCKVAYLAIGDELLVGQTINTNAAFLGTTLNLAGIEVVCTLTVRDTADAIRNGLELLAAKANVVIMTGGLGPTKDDITKSTLASYFNTRLVTDSAQLERINAYFSKRKRPMLDVNLRQAEVVEGCDVIPNFLGTSPGMWLEKNDVVYVSMPGVPYEMQAMMREYVLPRLEKMRGPLQIYHRTLLTQGIGESFLADRIKHIEKKLLKDGLGLAYLPSPGMVKLRITARAGTEATMKQIVQTYAEEIYKTVGEFIYGEAADKLEEIVGTLCRKHNLRIGFVESCSGGRLGSQIASVPGASDYFAGSMVAYAYAVKENLVRVPHDILVKEGAVSEACAREMAARGRDLLNVDICISTTGIAGPTGETDDKPVGLVWFGLADKSGVSAHKRIFGSDRNRNIQMTVNEALRMLQLHIQTAFPK